MLFCCKNRNNYEPSCRFEVARTELPRGMEIFDRFLNFQFLSASAMLVLFVEVSELS